MSVDLNVLQKVPQPNQERFEHAMAIAQDLLQYMNQDDVQAKIAERHVLGAASGEIQEIILGKANALGFHSEKRGLFADYPTARLRPDYYLAMGDSGIIMEVERGKTTTNNMDFLDLWKCHICKSAHFLFLIVPKVRPSANGTKMRLFRQVGNRLATFFEPENHVNVEAVFLFGY